MQTKSSKFHFSLPVNRNFAFLTLVCGVLACGGWMQGEGRIFKWEVHDMKRPQPVVVAPGAACVTSAPSDAIVLMGSGSGPGSDGSAWLKAGTQSPIGWDVKNGTMAVVPGSGDIETKESFGDCQLHLEWMVPTGAHCQGQHGCNSGVFFFSRYELQIVNSNGNTTYSDGMAGALYGQYPPLVNACRPQGEWNSYDIVFRGPRFHSGGELNRPASMTVLFNGVLVQDNSQILGATAHGARASYSAHPETGKIKLQDHGDPIQFRNIWVRPLGDVRSAE